MLILLSQNEQGISHTYVAEFHKKKAHRQLQTNDAERSTLV
jgi:hypothetical protein